jgi:regulation of enolase protein 1 (concanavalin A-like superfamily)
LRVWHPEATSLQPGAATDFFRSTFHYGRDIIHALVISLPAKDHDYRPAPGKQHAPRVLRDLEGNFTAKVKVGGDLDAHEGGRSAGIFLGQDERNVIRLERLGRHSSADDSDKQPLFFEYWQDTQPKSGTWGVVEVPLKGRIAWFRLTRRTDKLNAEASADGGTWIEAKTLSVRLSSRLNLGVMATNPSGRPREARFDGFEFRGIPLYPTDR